MSLRVRTTSGAATERVAAELGRRVGPGTVIVLVGELGAGKTTFVRGLVRGLGGTMRVKSPTFALAHTYETDPPVHHLDLYRLEDEEAAIELGLEEMLLDPGAISCVEWADRAPGLWESASFVRVRFPSNPSRSRVLELDLGPGAEEDEDALQAALQAAARGD